MRKNKPSYAELIQKNKEELLKDREQIEKIEKRIEEKHVNPKINNESAE
ncbi:hypothetical protein JOC85_001008 [Bacillus mesophilus]|uniref:FbpB family small basic protein n=1 Tax=Bacillus mesophilus TaxID=1808955 RepID=A0A6M0Q594_9BACI|nr:FbpB family small basic protein [Bacillus mesophilus]MBM7660241.1 hypothetical protein [Bacillus mesophilus]NEY70959.1 FbpB family small basic protein [Bacillus mesophilus]